MSLDSEEEDREEIYIQIKAYVKSYINRMKYAVMPEDWGQYEKREEIRGLKERLEEGEREGSVFEIELYNLVF